MNIQEALLTRRTVHHYTDREVAPDVLERALEAARWAPNHKLTEPWRFVVAGKTTRVRLGEVARRLADKKADGLDAEERAAVVQKQVAKITDLPALVVVTSRRVPGDPFREREDYAATACAIHNFVLSLWGEGVGAQWGTGGITRDPETYAILDVDPEAHEIIGFIKAGYPEKVPTSRRRPLAEVVRWLP